MKHRHRFLVGTLATVVLAVALALLAAGEGGASAEGTIIYVDASATGLGNGTAWWHAFNWLDEALDAAASGDQIWVAEGTYKPTVEHGGTGSRYRSFQMVNGVAIYGGFDPDTGDTEWADRDWENNVTTLSGDIGISGDSSDNSYHVFYHPDGTGLDRTAILDGFRITGGNANGSYPHNLGGGMHNYSALPLPNSPTLTNCIFSGNWAQVGGGMFNYSSSPALTNCGFLNNSGESGAGMYNASSQPTLTGCTFWRNQSTGKGGGMYNWRARPTLTDCNFGDNSAIFGGGMYNYGASPTLTGCTFKDNSAEDHGGGIYNENSSSPALTGCAFEGNWAEEYGGGIHNENSSPALANCTFRDNSADYYGGGMANLSDSSPTLTGCIFSGNSAGYNGGGLFNGKSSPVLTTCTFLGNSANFGGAMDNSVSSPMLTNCTFSGNSARYDGGGMLNSYSSPTLSNCIFLGNSARYNGGGMMNKGASPTVTNCTFKANTTETSGGAGIYNDDSSPVLTNCILYRNQYPEIYDDGESSTVVTYSDVFGGYSGTGNIDEDPLYLDPVHGDLHLRRDSPCVDAGNNAAPNLPDYDLDGDPRILDGDHNGTAIVDMGVDELGRRLYLPLVLSDY